MFTERATGITKITKVETIEGGTPARVNRRTGEMFLNMSKLRKLPVEHRIFIMLHEMAHVALPTESEEEADAWAFKKYADMGYSLKQSVFTLTDSLRAEFPQHFMRMWLQLKRAEAYDREINGNTKV